MKIGVTRSFGLSTDIWAFGVMSWELWSLGDPP